MSTGGVIVRYVGSTALTISEVFSVDRGLIIAKPRKTLRYSEKGLPSMVGLLPTLELELDGEDEDPFGKISVRKEKTKYSISVTTNVPNEGLLIRATRKGQRAIVFRIVTDDFGLARFTTSRALAGFQVSLFLGSDLLHSVKAG